jgi:hypothetical protein
MRQHVDRRALQGCRPNLKKPGPLLAEPRLHPRRPKRPCRHVRTPFYRANAA